MLTEAVTNILPLVSDNGHPPSFNLAQFSVRHVDLEGQLRHPDSQMQLSRKVQVGEVDGQRLATAHFFTVHQHLVTAGGHLQSATGRKVRGVITRTRKCEAMSHFL